MPIADDILVVLNGHPGIDKRQVARKLRTLGHTLDPSSVNSHLYSMERAGRLRKIDGTPPAWFVTPAGPAQPVVPKQAPRARSGPSPARLQLPGKPLRAWQNEALLAWEARQCRGVVQAVTGTGKTRVGLEAAHAHLTRKGKVLIVVPSRALLAQWAHEATVLGRRVGRRGDGHSDDFRSSDVLVTTVHSAMNGVPLHGADGLLIADECHRYGAEQWSRALDSSYVRRLGLSATYERGDQGDQDYLHPYFGAEPTFDIDFERAIRDEVVVPFRLALAGVPLTPDDQRLYDEHTRKMSSAYGKLINEFGLPTKPAAAFMKAVAQAAQGDSAATRCARSYTSAFAKRRALLADNEAKLALLDALEGAVGASKGTLVFTQTKNAAELAAACLLRHGHSAAAIYGEMDGNERERLLEAFKGGATAVLSAPRVLDEGIDVPEASLGIVLAASSGRRQMIQRMGRILRHAEGKRVARMVIFFAEGTTEDPDEGGHEGFLEIALKAAEASAVFRGASSSRLLAFLGSR